MSRQNPTYTSKICMIWVRIRVFKLLQVRGGEKQQPWNSNSDKIQPFEVEYSEAKLVEVRERERERELQ